MMGVNKDDEMVGKISRGDLYYELSLIGEILDMAQDRIPSGADCKGVFAALEVARRMANDLGAKVST